MNVKMIDQNFVEKVHEMTVRILSEMGVAFEDADARETFRKHGASIDGKIVRIPESLLMDALKTVPKSFDIYGRNGKKWTIGGGSRLVASTCGPLSVLDCDGIHPNRIDDLRNFIKLHHTSDVVGMISPFMLEPRDIKSSQIHEFQTALCLKYTDKPLIGFTLSDQAAITSIDMIQNVYGRKDNVALGIISVISPCVYSPDLCSCLRIYVERNQPILIAPMSMCGVSGPVSMLGTLAIDNAQILAGVVYSQLLRPGASVIYGATSAACNLRYMVPSIGSAECTMQIMGIAAMSKYYGIPCRTGGGLSDAKLVDWQAGSEAMMNMMATVLTDVDFILQPFGILDSFSLMSYAKFILDEGNYKMLMKLSEYLTPDLSDDAIEEELQNIYECGVAGSYLTSDHTLEYFRDFAFVHDAYHKMDYNAYKEAGMPAVEELAYKQVEKRLEEYVEPALTSDQLAVISPYITELEHLL